MNTNPDRSQRFIKKIMFAAILLSLLIASLVGCAPIPEKFPDVPPPNNQAPTSPSKNQVPPSPIATQVPIPPSDDQAPVQPADQPVQPANQNDVSSAEVVGGWYGPACDEAEGTYIYRWSVDLMKDPQTGQLAGTVKFHNCPGGGRVLYLVGGNPPTGTVFTLAGDKVNGGGDLFGSAPESVTFTFDTSTGQIKPNLAP
jgi:hypothetical protein